MPLVRGTFGLCPPFLEKTPSFLRSLQLEHLEQGQFGLGRDCLLC